MRGDNAREAAERAVTWDAGNLWVCGVRVATPGPGWHAGPHVRRAIEELILKRDKEAAEAAGPVPRDRRGRADG